MRLLASIWTIPAIVLLIVGATLAWFAYDEYEQTLEQEYRFLEAHARIADGQLSGLLRNIKQLLNRIAEERPTLPAAKLGAYEATLVERKLDMPEIRTLAVVNAGGRVEITANPSLVGFDSSMRDYYTAHLGRTLEPNFHITRPFKSSFGDYSVTFSVAIRDRQQRFLGVAVAGVNYRFFDSVMMPIKPEGGSSVVAISNQQGDIVYRLPEPEKYVGASVAGGASFQEYLRAGRRMTRSIGVASLDGVKRMYVHRAIGNTTLNISMARPLDEVLAPWRRNLAVRALIFAFAAAVTLTLAGIAHRRQREVLAGKAFTDQLIDTANVMLIGLDTRGEVVIFNEAAEQISGYCRAEMLGRNWFETAVPRERYPQVWEVLRKFQETGVMPRTFESPILTKSGEERIIAWQNSELRRDGATAVTISCGIDITGRQQMEAIRRNEEVSRRLVSIQEEERRRLAAELHDRTSPNLSAIGININNLADALPPQASGESAHLLEDTSALLDDTIASIRSISFDFRPPVLDYAGLWPALEGYAQQFSRRTGIAVHAEKDDFDSRLAPDIETNLFRIAQEALTNCAKHSEAKTIRIGYARTDDTVELAIADDGVGFDPVAQLRAGNVLGHGLSTMRRRAEFIGGNFSLETCPGKGTRIAVTISAPHVFAGQPQSVRALH